MNIYFAGIGGVGLGPLAEIAKDAGHNVMGSDMATGSITSQLNSKNIKVSFDQSGEYLLECNEDCQIDWFVYTSSLPKNHPELIMAHDIGVPKITKRDELIAHIIQEKGLKMIAVAGTHGKTTTSSMLIWLFLQNNLPISYSTGTKLNFAPSGAYKQGSEYFIYECDEFDRNFLAFHPYLSVITSIDYDHPDTYPLRRDYIKAFNQFISQSKQTIMWQKDLNDGITTPTNTLVLQDNAIIDGIKLSGVHNRANASLVIKAIKYLDVNFTNDTINMLSQFPGSGRRFEMLAHNLYSDYGHHPAEIKATLQMASELSKNVVLVYQPHQNVRQYEIKDEYRDCFEVAQKIYWLPTYLTREDPDLPVLTPQQLISGVINKSSVIISDLNDDLWANIVANLKQNKLVLCMGAGTIDGWLHQHIDNK